MSQPPGQYDSPWKEALELESDFKAQVKAYEESENMPYVTSIERMALEEGFTKGREEGRQEGWSQGTEEGLAKGLEQGVERGVEQGQLGLLRRLLRRRWPDLPATVEKRVTALTLDQQGDLAEALLDLSTLADLKKWLADRAKRG